MAQYQTELRRQTTAVHSFASIIESRDVFSNETTIRKVMGMEEDANTTDFTIVAVLTCVSLCRVIHRQNRLFFFDHLLRLWTGRFTFVLFCYSHEEPTIRRFFAHQSFPSRMAVVMYTEPTPGDAPGHFPVNKMRNLGIANVHTSHFIVTDMDLWPSRTLPSRS